MSDTVASDDVYYKKTIAFNDLGARLDFRVSQSLFSSFAIDVGTRFLLRTLVGEAVRGWRTILDLGCGYGPIGLTLGKLMGRGAVHLVDRDALAVTYCRQNAALNAVHGAQVYGSLGFDDIDERSFDVIVSNIPGKAGEAVITSLLVDAVHYLAPGGLVAVVVVTPLVSLVQRVLHRLTGIEVTLQQARSGHAVFHYRRVERSIERGVADADLAAPTRRAFDRGIYDRTTARLRLGGESVEMLTVYGLPAFDSLSRETELLLEGISRLPRASVRDAIVINPGQGHVPLAVWNAFAPATIRLADRDLLALRASRRNLLRAGCPLDERALIYRTGLDLAPGPRADLVVGVLRENEPPAATAAMLEQARGLITPGGAIVVSGSSTAVTRCVAAVQGHALLRIEERRRRGGNSLLVLRAGE